MDANESEALRWVARQWERRIETDVILNVYGMLWADMRREGDCSIVEFLVESINQSGFISDIIHDGI